MAQVTKVLEELIRFIMSVFTSVRVLGQQLVGAYTGLVHVPTLVCIGGGHKRLACFLAPTSTSAHMAPVVCVWHRWCSYGTNGVHVAPCGMHVCSVFCLFVFF